MRPDIPEGMRCPNCGSLDHAVIDKRGSGDANWRRRKCGKCGFRWTTYERSQNNTQHLVVGGLQTPGKSLTLSHVRRPQ